METTTLLSAVTSVGDKLIDFFSEFTTQSWIRNSLLVSSATAVNLLALFFAVYFWSVNRQTHLKKTKGSEVPHRDTLVDDTVADDDEDADDTSDEDEDSEHAEEKDVGESESWEGGDLDTLAGPQHLNRKTQRMESSFRRSIKLKRISDIVFEEEDEEEELGVRERAKQSEESSLPHDPSWERSMIAIARSAQVFSYLGDKAQNLCMQHAEYVDVQRGKCLFEQCEYDGSLYVVLTGSLVTRFHDHVIDDENLSAAKTNGRKSSVGMYNCVNGRRVLSFVSNPGDVVTPLLAMIEGLISEIRGVSIETSRGELFAAMKGTFSTISSAETTRLIRVSPKCTAAILEKHPAEVFKIAQHVLTRLQRVTIQCVVKTLGLRKELITNPKGGENGAFSGCSSWIHLTTAFATTNDVETLEKLEPVKADAISIAASVLSVPSDCEESMKLMKEESKFVFIPPGKDIISTGMVCKSFYILLKGQVQLGSTFSAGTSTKFDHYFDIQPGSLIGLQSTFTGEISFLTERSSPDGTGTILLQFPRAVLEKLLVTHPETLTQCLELILGFIPPVVRLIDWNSSYLHVHASENVVKRGKYCDSLFVVLNGRLRSSFRENSGDRFQEYGRGQTLGEVSSLTGSRWPSDVYAIRNSEVAKLPISVLLSIIRMYPHTGLHFARMIATQVQSSHKDHMYKSTKASLSPFPQNRNGKGLSLPSYGLSLATIAVVPFVADVNTSSFCSMLVSELKEIAPTAHVTKAFVKEHIGEQQYSTRNTMRDIKVTRLLGELEESHRLVVYEADFKYTWWTRQCIQQADCVLLVVNSDEAPKERRVEQCLDWVYQSMNVRIDLVVLHRTTTKDNFTEDHADDISEGEGIINVSDQLNDWSEKRKWIANHHRIRMPFGRHSFDFYRMCRRITGRSVGLVLGGGGARGIAHIGVIRALMEAGVMVDLVGGTSQGAFVGALYAENPDDFDSVVCKCHAFAKMMSSVWNKLIDLTLPLTSIFSGKHFNKCIRCILGDIRIQDTVLTFFCTSVDVQKRRQMVHKKGSLWKYVRASMSLTGYLPPICEDGSMLVDGGYLNAVPADVMRESIGARTVIAVDVSMEKVRDYHEYGTHLSGWWLLWNSLNPFVTTVNVPSMTDINDSLRWVSSDRHRRNVKNFADLNLTPPVTDYNTLAYDQWEEIMEVGYNYAKPIIDEWVRNNPDMVSTRLRKRSIAAAAISMTRKKKKS